MKIQKLLAFCASLILLSSCSNIEEVDRSFVTPERDIEVCQNLEFKEHEDGYEVSVQKAYENTSIVIPATYNEKPVVKIADRGFYDCQTLKMVHIPNTIRIIGLDAFANCTGLKMMNIPWNVAYIEEGAFDGVQDCGIVFGKSYYPEDAYIALLHWSNNLAFNCNDFIYNDNYMYGIRENGATFVKAFGDTTKFNIPRSITYYDKVMKVDRLANNTFRNFEDTLEEVNIPATVEIIDDEAFLDCRALKSIRIPSSVEVMGKNVFKGCTNLKIQVDLEEKPSLWDDSWNPDNLEVTWKSK